jgi:autoinducer 2-degrading protein
MVVTCVQVEVKPDRVDDFVKATIANHEGSIKEPGNMRFDVLQSEENPARFLLYEAYESEQVAAAHKETAHYLKWRGEVAEMMAEPRKGTRYRAVRP